MGKAETYYRTCPFCGANLDPGESCRCRELENKNYEEREEKDYDNNR